MRRHYKTMSRAQRDAVAERKAERMREAGIETRPLLPPRQPLALILSVDGQKFVVRGEPARHSKQWHLTLNGEPIGIGGAEKAWRAIQRKRVPMLGERNML